MTQVPRKRTAGVNQRLKELRIGPCVGGRQLGEVGVGEV